MAKLGTVWERAAEFAGERIGALSPIALGAIALPTVLSSGLPVLALAGGPGMQVAAMALALLLSIVSMWGSLAVTAWAIDPESRAAAAGLARRRLLAVLLVSIGVGAVAALFFLPIPIFLGFRGYDVAQVFAGGTAQVAINARPTIDPQSSGLIGLYMLVLFPLMATIFVRLVLLGPVVLREARLFGAGPAGTLTLALGLTLLVQAIVQTVIVVLLAAFQGKLYAALAAEAAPAA